MIPLQLDTGLIRDWSLVPHEAAELRNSGSLHCYNRLHTYAQTNMHVCACLHIHILLIHQSPILHLDMKQVALP